MKLTDRGKNVLATIVLLAALAILILGEPIASVG